ncbi:NAD(P)-binding domain-containing protein [Yoonia sediminilitoris]|uniref:Pyrroline-5-carboxylate reductase catalytic N-terminal domain-containing protein n=1 Tax=Yoonia sediminilitoris TaxID=1286148 RepID=A0A2T6KFX3_9RHOB|nr:NAD(P)-binding domain-containing protein [Yoonia sediminilitoris]PUB14222.1 hypothetical protein C8N45_10696 [Yoonia sediminilitoris]RCW95153.1 hypothetical protein DFP92_10696 [Yoonia sediminilitoris]
MKIAVIGNGNAGSGLAAVLPEAGHDVGVYGRGDDLARERVKRLAGEIGLVPFDAGPLKNARYLESMGFTNIQFGDLLGHGDENAPQWLAT